MCTLLKRFNTFVKRNLVILGDLHPWWRSCAWGLKYAGIYCLGRLIVLFPARLVGARLDDLLVLIALEV
jgi:hypothetical protein